MRSRVLLGAVVVVLTIAAVGWLRSSGRGPVDPAGRPRSAGSGLHVAELPDAQSADGRVVADLERRVETLAAELAAETAERQRLEDRLDAFAAQMPAPPTADVAAAEPASASPAETSGAGADAAAPVESADAANGGTTPLERALVAAGVDPDVAADVKRRQDEVAMAEIYLRDQATREGWLDSPRFHDELERVQQQRISIRDEIGDDSYDRYLTALGEPNRVRVAEVLTASPAAAVGLQAGDVVLRYGDTRIFAPDDLVSETRSGTAGEPVRVEILRDGQRLDIEVPRGPLGLRIAASQANPDEG
jgi:membrane-associated protease RseP (regulator of RpoE activity)